MRIGPIALATLAAILAPTLAQAARMSLGANLGLAQLSSGGSSTVVLQAPSDVYFGIQPGFRIGFPSQSGMDDVYFDVDPRRQHSRSGTAFWR